MNILPSSLFKIYDGQTSASLNLIKKLQKQSKIAIPLKLIHPYSSDKSVSIPNYLNKELAEFLGLHYAEGLLRDSQFTFSNSDPQIIDRWRELTQKLFGSNLNYYTQRAFDTTDQVFINSKTIQEFLEGIGVHVNSEETGKKSTEGSLPSCILTAPYDLQLHFLNGFFAGDGSFNIKNEFSATFVLHSSSISMVNGFCSILSQLGISYTINHRPEGKWKIRGKTGQRKKSYRILIHNEEMQKFLTFSKSDFFGYRKTRAFLAFLPKLDLKQTKKKNEYTIWLKEDLLWQIKRLAHYTTRDIPNRLRPLDKEKITAAQLQVTDCLNRPLRKTKRRGFSNSVYANLFYLLGINDTKIEQTLTSMKDLFFDRFYLDIITEVEHVEQELPVYTIEVETPALAIVGGETLSFLAN